MQLSIIVVNWNTNDLLSQCLDLIFRTSNGLEFEVIVVDNASVDGSPEMVQKRFPQVCLIQNPKNIGFARGNNQGIRQSRGRYVLLLNSDTIVMPGALQTLLEFMDRHTEAGGVGARLISPDSSLQFSCSPAPTLMQEVLRIFHLPGVRPDGYYPMETWDQNQPHIVDVILGACMFLRTETLNQIGLLDEDYFMFSEEVDLCLRIRRAGWRLYWVPQSHIIHYGGQSTQQASTKMFLSLYESKLIYFRKNHGHFIALIYKLLLMVASLVRLSIVPLAWLEDSHKRRMHIALAHNYQLLFMKLPSM